MAYTDLIPTPIVSETAQDCSFFTVEDNTGEYPASPGGYAPLDEGTPTRPQYLDVHIFWVFRSWAADGTYVDIYPDEQPPFNSYPTPYTFSLLDEFGEPNPDAIYQAFMVVAPADVTYETFLEIPEEERLSYAVINWALGSCPVPILCEVTNCRNDALRRMDNAAIAGKCVTDEFALKNALLQAIEANEALAGGAEILSNAQAAYYAETQAEIEYLLEICANPDCKCNC